MSPDCIDFVVQRSTLSNGDGLYVSITLWHRILTQFSNNKIIDLIRLLTIAKLDVGAAVTLIVKSGELFTSRLGVCITQIMSCVSNEKSCQ